MKDLPKLSFKYIGRSTSRADPELVITTDQHSAMPVVPSRFFLHPKFLKLGAPKAKSAERITARFILGRALLLVPSGFTNSADGSGLPDPFKRRPCAERPPGKGACTLGPSLQLDRQPTNKCLAGKFRNGHCLNQS